MKDEIFNAYLEDRCPLCDSDNLSLVSENIGAGKTLSSTFFCISCKSDYVVGFNRSFNPIQSEILTDNYNKKTTILNKKDKVIEFKGTKGKWVLNYDSEDYPNMLKVNTEDGNIVFDFGDDTQYYPTAGQEPNEYDALLISKAPELLEMLIKCTDMLAHTTEHDVLEKCQLLVDKSNKLITEATTL